MFGMASHDRSSTHVCHSARRVTTRLLLSFLALSPTAWSTASTGVSSPADGLPLQVPIGPALPLPHEPSGGGLSGPVSGELDFVSGPPMSLEAEAELTAVGLDRA